MVRIIYLTLVLLTVSHPLMAQPHHFYHAGAHGSHSNITCEMVRAYVAQVGTAQALAIAQSAGMTVSEEQRARRCLESKI